MKFIIGRRYKVANKYFYTGDIPFRPGEIGSLTYQDTDLVKIQFNDGKEYYYLKLDVRPVNICLEIGT